MHIFDVIVKKIEDNFIIIKCLTGIDVWKRSGLSFIQIVGDRYIQTVQIFFPNVPKK